MLCAELVVAPDDRPLEEAPNAFHAVCVHVGADPFLDVVVNRLMTGVLVSDALVGRPRVGVDGLSVVGDHGLDKAMQRLLVVALLDPEPDFATALDGPHDHRLIATVAPALAPRLAANKRLVYLDKATQGPDEAI